MIRGLPNYLKRAVTKFSRDYASGGPKAKERVEGLRERLGCANFTVLVAAAVYGAGPEKLRQISGVRFSKAKARVQFVLDEAAKYYGVRIPGRAPKIRR